MRHPVRLVALLLTAGLLASCARVPSSGPVVEARNRGAVAQAQSPYFNPKGPQPGQSPADVVNGFLVAMTATPLTVRVAQKFLSRQARSQWRPTRVISYHDRTETRESREVVVRLQGADAVSGDARWKGALPASQRRLTFPMVREDGQWRIDAAPDALIVPRTFYDQQYSDDTLIYFFDPTARILVPEPVHVPQGSLVSSLVRAVLRGPSPSLRGVVRTFLPPGLTVNAVPVTRDGVALVNLGGPDPGPLNSKTTNLIVAQLGWTLRQDPAIHGFRVTIDGRSVADATGTQTFRVPSDVPGGQTASSRYDPAVGKVSAQFYALRRGRLVSGPIGRPTSVNGPFGNAAQGIGSFAVRLDGKIVAGVTPGGLLTGPVLGDQDAREVLSGSGLLRPAWDFADRLWDVQVGPRGASVVYIENGRRHQVRVPGITGEDVNRFLLSRDGSRLVAVVHRPGSDRIMLSRIRYVGPDAVGSRARRIPWLSTGATRVRDIGWTSPTTIAVLDQFSRSQAEVRILAVDGSTPPEQAPPILVNGLVSGLVSSANQTPYVVQGSGITQLSRDSAQTVPNPQIPTNGLRHITYAG